MKHCLILSTFLCCNFLAGFNVSNFDDEIKELESYKQKIENNLEYLRGFMNLSIAGLLRDNDAENYDDFRREYENLSQEIEDKIIEIDERIKNLKNPSIWLRGQRCAQYAKELFSHWCCCCRKNDEELEFKYFEEPVSLVCTADLLQDNKELQQQIESLISKANVIEASNKQQKFHVEIPACWKQISQHNCKIDTKAVLSGSLINTFKNRNNEVSRNIQLQPSFFYQSGTN